MAKGINVRCSQGELVFDAFLQDPAGNLVTSGSTYFRLYRVIGASGTIESFDWNDASFKQSTLTTENLSASHRKGNNGVRDTGLWTTRLSSLGNFSLGDICYLQVDNTYSSPKIQTQKFQFGSAEGDMTVNTSGFLNVNVNSWRDSIPEILQTGMVHAWSTNTGSSSSGSSGDVNVVSWGGTSVSPLIAGRMDSYVSQIATNAIDANSLNSDVATEINSGMPTLSDLLSISGKFNNLSVNVSGWRGELPAILNSSRVNVYVEDMAANVINSNVLATSAVTEIQTGLATNSDILSISGKFNNLSVNVSGWRGLQPNILISGLVDVYPASSSSTGSDVNVITWGGVSVPALVSGMLPVLVNDYHEGKWPLQPQVARRNVDVTSSGTIGINWGNIENNTAVNRLINTSISGVDYSSGSSFSTNVNVTGWLGLPPNPIFNGRVDVYVGEIGTNIINATSLAADAVAEMNAGLPTLSDLLSISGKFSNLSVNISGWRGIEPAILNSNRVNVYVEDMATDVINSNAISASAITEIQNGLARQSDIISISGLIQSPTGILNVNVIQWLGSGVNSLVSGYMPSIVQMYASGQVPLKPTVENRTLDVTSNGNAGIDWSNIENPTSPVNLVNTSVSGVNYFSLGNVSVNVSGWRGLSPNVLQNGRVDAYVGAMGTDVLNAAALASDAVTEIQNGLSTTSQILSISGYLPRLDVNVSTRLAPSVTGRTLDVTISGTTGINWGNIENPTTRNLLTNTSISGIDNFVSGIFEANVVKWRGDVPDVLATGMVHSYINGLTGNTDVNVITWAGVSVSPLISGLLPVLVNDYDVGKWPLQPIVDNRKIDVSTSGYVGIFANLDKQNYILGPSGLDYISVIHPTGTASNYREMGIQTWRRFFKKTTLNAASGIITFDDNDTTIITRQAVSDNGTTQTQFSS